MRFFAPDVAAIRWKGGLTTALGAFLALTGAIGTFLPLIGILPRTTWATLWPWISLPFGMGLLAMGWAGLREAASLARERRLRRARRSP